MVQQSYISLAFARIIALLILVMAASSAKATGMADTLQTEIYYLQGDASYRPEWRDNAKVARNIVNAISRGRVRSVNIISSASPEGTTAFNRELSVRRSFTAVSLLGLDPDSVDFNVMSIGVDWQGLAERVTVSGMPMADSITDIILNTPEWVFSNGAIADSRKKRLMDLRGGTPWFSMLDSIFPDLRVSRITIVYDHALKAPDPIALTMLNGTDSLSSLQVPDVINVSEANILPIKRRRVALALRSNLLFDAAAVPNIGLSASLGRGWSVAIDAHYADWHNRRHSRFWRVQGAELSVRKSLTYTPPHSNHWFLEAYTQLFRYNICLGKNGYLSSHSDAEFFDKPSLGAGIGGGYSLSLSPLLSLDFSLGLGYVCGQYQTYRIIDRHLVWQTTRQRHYLGLSRAGISLVWHLMKGGRRW